MAAVDICKQFQTLSLTVLQRTWRLLAIMP